jgi:hypothetical protein
MRSLVLVEVLAGVTALILAAMAFTSLTWAEGASSQAMKRASAVKAKRLFLWAAGFAVVTAVCAYLSMHQPTLPPEGYPN